MSEEQSFFSAVEASYEVNIKRFNNTLNIALVGTVSSGKSSLINALLRRDRMNMIASVGAEAGTTVRLQTLKLDEHVRIIDCPGLMDIKQENSEITKDFLKFIDIGILVVNGAADSVQRSHLHDLKASCSQTFVVLNKIDQWDRNNSNTLIKIEAQWKTALNIGTLYKVCCFGYDPDTDPDIHLDIRGIDDLRREIESFLAFQGKDMLLARHLMNKEHDATQIISTTLVAVAVGSLLPGASIIVVPAQISALYSLYYLYTGKILTKAVIGSIILAASGQGAVTSLFLAVKSFLPPTGIVDVFASYAAVLFTFSLLAAFTKVLVRGTTDIAGEQLLKEFKSVKINIESIISDSNKSDWSKPDFWNKIIKSALF